MQKMGMETREPCSEQWILHDPAESCPAAVGMLWYAYKIGPQLCALSCVIILPASKTMPCWRQRSAETYLCHPLS
jgi:hypothetical protein